MDMNTFGDMLDDIAGEIPREFFKDLNGGIVLRPEYKIHPQARENDLCIMGQYQYNSRMGRTIFIYYGSFERLYGHLSYERLKKRVKDTVLHEFTHHFESLAGERDLEIEDEVQLAKYNHRMNLRERRPKEREHKK